MCLGRVWRLVTAISCAMRLPEIVELAPDRKARILARGGTAARGITSGSPALDRHPEICSDFVHCPRSNGRGSGNLARRSSGTGRPLSQRNSKEAGTTWVQVLRQGGPAVNLLRVR